MGIHPFTWNWGAGMEVSVLAGPLPSLLQGQRAELSLVAWHIPQALKLTSGLTGLGFTSSLCVCPSLPTSLSLKNAKEHEDQSSF